MDGGNYEAILGTTATPLCLHVFDWPKEGERLVTAQAPDSNATIITKSPASRRS